MKWLEITGEMDCPLLEDNGKCQNTKKFCPLYKYFHDVKLFQKYPIIPDDCELNDIVEFKGIIKENKRSL